MWGVQIRPRKLQECRVSVNIEVYKMLILTHTEVPNAMPTVHTTLDYGYRHKSKGTSLILVPRKCEVYKLDQESYKMCRVSKCTGLILVSRKSGRACVQQSY